MTRDERLAIAEERARRQLATQQRRLAHIQAQQREDERKALTRRRQQVGKLADKAGLLGWDDTTLDQLFVLLGTLRDVPHPVAVLEGLLSEVAVGAGKAL